MMPGLLAHFEALTGPREVIIVDGGSTDGTREMARSAPGVRLLEADRGRGMQIAAGAEAATGEVLLVLHADTRLPADALARVEEALAGGARWGWFNVRYDAGGPWLRLVTRYVNAHACVLGEPTGENAIWATRAAWEQAGGCPRIPILEDLELARRLRRVGRGTRLAGPVICSARRYRAWTPLGMNLRCSALWLAFHLGVAPHRLAPLYPKVR